MHWKKIVNLSMLVFLLKISIAQVSVSNPLKFHSINQIGLIEGQSNSSFHLQSVNGVQLNNWFAGLGAALDYYRYRNIPVFIDVRKYFGKTGNQLFIYGDAGASYVWKKTETHSVYTSSYSPGFYSNAGIGYKVGFKNGMAIVVNAGYSYKKVEEKQKQDICGIIGPCYLNVDTYKYDLNRLILQIGFMF